MVAIAQCGKSTRAIHRVDAIHGIKSKGYILKL